MDSSLEALRARVRALQAALAARGITFRPPPPEPTTCCGRGCNGCVWEGFHDASAYWLEQAAERLGPGQAGEAPGPTGG